MVKLFKMKLLLLITVFTTTIIAKSYGYKSSIKTVSQLNQANSILVLHTIPEDLAQNVSPDANIIVEFSGNPPNTFYQNVNFNLLQGNKIIEGDLFYNPATKQIMFKPKMPLKNGTTYTGYVSWVDSSTNQKQEKIWNFVVNDNNNLNSSNEKITSNFENPENSNFNSYLQITKTSISKKITPNKPLELTFSEPIDLISLRSAPIKLYQNSNNKEVGIDYRLSRDRRTITIVPRETLKSNITYTVAINTNLASINGLRLDKNYALQFSLVSNLKEDNSSYDDSLYANDGNATYPDIRTNTNFEKSTLDSFKVINIVPQNNQIINNLSQAIYVTFNEEVREETVNEFTFKLEDNFGPIPARIRYIKGKKQAILTPIGVLDAGKKYRIVLTRGIIDVYGRNLAQDYTSYFTVSIDKPINQYFANNNITKNQQITTSDNTDLNEIESYNEQIKSSLYSINNGNLTDEDYSPVIEYNPPISQNYKNISKNIIKGNYSQAKPNYPQRLAHQNIRNLKRSYSEPMLSTFKVSRILPGANAINVPRNTKIYIYFSEPVNVSTVNAVNISIFGEQKRVEGKVFYDSSKFCAIFIPDEPLRPDTEYKVIVSDKIRSQKGEFLAGKVKWQFLTAKEPVKTLNYKVANIEADASFDIPLADRKANQAFKYTNKMNTNNYSFSKAPIGISMIKENHWVIKSLKHLSSKGLLYNVNVEGSITRYEIVNALNLALSNLRQQQYNPTLKLKLSDLTELYKLVYEFKRELKAFAIETNWFENFMIRNGITPDYIEASVKELNRRYN